jgi:acyl-CoA thioesterase-2
MRCRREVSPLISAFFSRPSRVCAPRREFVEGIILGDFELDTRVAGGAGRYRASLSEDWRIWGPNGGYLATIALRAVGCEAKIARPSSFHAHFLAVGGFREVEVAVEPIRIGKRSESYRVNVLQDGKALLEGMVRTAADGPGLEHDVARAPAVAAPESLRNVETIVREKGLAGGPRFPFWENIESRPLEPDRIGNPGKRPPGSREWYRFRPRATFDDPWTDAGRALLLIDTMSWPAAVGPHQPEPGYTAPNLDVTAWFHRAAPGSEWLLAEHACDVAEGGLMGTHARIWSPDGALLASGGAQLYCIPASNP